MYSKIDLSEIVDVHVPLSIEVTYVQYMSPDLLAKPKGSYLLTCNVNRYFNYLLALHSSTR